MFHSNAFLQPWTLHHTNNSLSLGWVSIHFFLKIPPLPKINTQFNKVLCCLICIDVVQTLFFLATSYCSRPIASLFVHQPRELIISGYWHRSLICGFLACWFQLCFTQRFFMYYNLNEQFGRERGGVKMNWSVTIRDWSHTFGGRVNLKEVTNSRVNPNFTTPPSSPSSLTPSYKNLVLIQDKSSYLISFNILITCLLYNIWEFWGENTC